MWRNKSGESTYWKRVNRGLFPQDVVDLVRFVVVARDDDAPEKHPGSVVLVATGVSPVRGLQLKYKLEIYRHHGKYLYILAFT